VNETVLAFVEVIVKATVVVLALQGAVSYLVLVERRTASFMQDRIGPNRCGPFGLLQPLADAAKLLFKEDITPRHVHRGFYVLAPILALIPALSTIAVVPFGPALAFSTEGGTREVLLQVTDLNVGVLYMFSISSLGVYGLALGGWASANKFSLLGGIRSSAQMVSYELALTLAGLSVIMATGTLRLNEIVLAQGPWPWQWHVFGFGEGGWRLLTLVPMLVAGVIFIVSFFAETNRLPFDLPEAESELVSGYHTEYSSMKFGLFFLAEYANMLTGSAVIATMFFGGWLFPGWSSQVMQEHPLLLGLCAIGTFVAKTAFFLFVMMWVRWTLPRFRFDQLMTLGWKRFLPVALGCVVAVAALRALLPGA
jgi:NADH-quinone oxidoreductase subunit H